MLVANCIFGSSKVSLKRAYKTDRKIRKQSSHAKIATTKFTLSSKSNEYPRKGLPELSDTLYPIIIIPLHKLAIT